MDCYLSAIFRSRCVNKNKTRPLHWLPGTDILYMFDPTASLIAVIYVPNLLCETQNITKWYDTEIMSQNILFWHKISSFGTVIV